MLLHPSSFDTDFTDSPLSKQRFTAFFFSSMDIGICAVEEGPDGLLTPSNHRFSPIDKAFLCWDIPVFGLFSSPNHIYDTALTLSLPASWNTFFQSLPGPVKVQVFVRIPKCQDL